MRHLSFLFLLFACSSCFLFRDFRSRQFVYSGSSAPEVLPLMVPKGFQRIEDRKDSSGNEEQYFYYANGSCLYFVRDRDTARSYQPIDYGEQLPKEIYSALFFKGIDASGYYWRENRLPGFRAGYFKVPEGNDWLFDSSLNYFSRQLRHGSPQPE